MKVCRFGLALALSCATWGAARAEISNNVVRVGVSRTLAATIAKQVHGTVAATSPTKNSIVVSTHFALDRVHIGRFVVGAEVADSL